MKKRFGTCLKSLRLRAGLTQVQLAELVGLSDRYLGRMERGLVSPSFECIERLAEALAIDTAELFLLPGQVLRRQDGPDTTLEDALHERATILKSLPGLTVKFLDQDLRILWAHTNDPESPLARGIDCTGLTCHEAFHGSATPCAGCLLPRTFAEMAPMEGEVTVPSGRSFLIRCTPVVSGDGVLRGALHLSLDITARKAVEEDLRRTRQRLEHMLSSMPAVLYACNVDEKFSHSYISANAGEVFGHHPEDFLGNPDYWWSQIHPADRGRVRESLPVLMAEGHVVLEYRIRHATRGWRWVRDDMRLDCGPDGAPREVFGAALDITDSKAAEIALRDSESRYRTLFLNNCTVQLVTDVATGTILDANPAAEAFYGYPLERLRGLPIGEINTMGPDMIQEALNTASAAGQRLFRFRHRLADDSLRDVEVRVTPMDIAGRAVVHSLIIDVTDR